MKIEFHRSGAESTAGMFADNLLLLSPCHNKLGRSVSTSRKPTEPNIGPTEFCRFLQVSVRQHKRVILVYLIDSWSLNEHRRRLLSPHDFPRLIPASLLRRVCRAASCGCFASEVKPNAHRG